MKASDLMVGDWVICNYYPDKPCYMQFGVGDFAKCGFEFCDPVPLTPEILEKNGFVIKKKWAQLGNFGDSPLIMWHFVDEPVLKHYKHELEVHQNDTGKVHVHIPCECVHELQHALRLCGIEKVIIL